MASSHFQHVKYKSIHGKEDGIHVLILAGVHGDEYEPMAAAMQLAETIPGLIKKGTVTIVPIVNMSAFKKGSRVGEDSLDLARTCPGKKDGSVTEVIASEVSDLISRADRLIDLHTGGSLFEILPFCGYVLHSSEEVLYEQRVMAEAFNMPTVWGTSSRLDGRTLSVARDLNIPAIYAEFGGGGSFNKKAVEEYVQGCLNVLNLLGVIVGSEKPNQCTYLVEDNREESGHLQTMFPAPTDGFFEAKVYLGDFIEKGQVIGTIKGVFGECISTVRSDQDGRIFMLRAIPSVQKGNALGGILPILRPGKVEIS